MLPPCLDLPALDDPFEIPLPGGISLEDIDPLPMLQAALAPLAPFFRVLDVVLQLFNCVKAIPDAISLPPDPSALLACVPELAKKIAKVIELVPVLTIPLMIKRILQLVIRTLNKLRMRLAYLQAQMTRIEAAIDRAKQLKDPGLMAIAGCAKANVTQEAANLMKSLAGVGRLLGILQLLLGLVPGAPPIPDLTSLTGQPLNAVIEPLGAVVSALQSAANLIPVP